MRSSFRLCVLHLRTPWFCHHCRFEIGLKRGFVECQTESDRGLERVEKSTWRQAFKASVIQCWTTYRSCNGISEDWHRLKLLQWHWGVAITRLIVLWWSTKEAFEPIWLCNPLFWRTRVANPQIATIANHLTECCWQLFLKSRFCLLCCRRKRGWNIVIFALNKTDFSNIILQHRPTVHCNYLRFINFVIHARYSRDTKI